MPYFVVLRRGEVMEQTCLRCHSTPAQAPTGLIAKYGPQKSFDRHVGDVVSAISIRIPLSSELIAVRPDIPIIIRTGFSERVDKEIATSIGIKDFLLKPIVRFELARAVRQVLDESGKCIGSEIILYVDVFSRLTHNLYFQYGRGSCNSIVLYGTACTRPQSPERKQFEPIDDARIK